VSYQLTNDASTQYSSRHTLGMSALHTFNIDLGLRETIGTRIFILHTHTLFHT
jgi:hypothetical protein